MVTGTCLLLSIRCLQVYVAYLCCFQVELLLSGFLLRLITTLGPVHAW